jgi:hypothetical protein
MDMNSDANPVADKTVGKAQGLAIGGENRSGERSRYTYDGSVAVPYAMTQHEDVAQAPSALRTAQGPARDTFAAFNDGIGQAVTDGPCNCPDCTKAKAAEHSGRSDERRRGLLYRDGLRYPVQFGETGYDGV